MDSLNSAPSLVLRDTRDHNPGNGKRIDKQYLVNQLNYFNFQNKTISINLKHATYNRTISLLATPLPCSGDQLDCVWCQQPDLGRILQTYQFQDFCIADGKRILQVEPEVIGMSEQGISFLLPDACREIGSRKMRRYPVTGIEALLIQNGAEFCGVLRDFSAVSLRIELTADPLRGGHWIDGESPVHLTLADGRETIFSGECRIIRQARENSSSTFVLEPLQHQLRRFKPKVYRSARHKLVPSPKIYFRHPLINTRVSLRVNDLSGSGFSVEEDTENSVLLAGMILPALEICFSDSFRIGCTAQIVYRNSGGRVDCSDTVTCGLAILDMDPEDHLRLMAHLNQAANDNTYLCNNVDMDALWNFFFETGFIYPEKYVSFEGDRDEMKKMYEVLYNQHPSIARHFIYQERGKIIGHMAMIRFYENSWMIHHHAADRSESIKAGLVVLKQISRYVNDIHQLRSAHLHFVFCYFRPDNKFPERVFGEFARKLDDPHGCSVDTFAYFHYRRPEGGDPGLTSPWVLAEAHPLDFEELKGFYGQESGGLMLDAFDLEAEDTGYDELAREYRDLGFRKEKYHVALKKGGVLSAVILANIMDSGVNMSNLTSCATVVVLDESLPRDILFMALSTVAEKYEHGRMPVLVYPVSYAKREALHYEKLYSLWVLNLQYLDHYFKFCDTLFRYLQKTS